MTPTGPLPNLLIAGVGKAGTTSLFWYLSQHPDICASKVKEPRYFLLREGDELGSIGSYRRLFEHWAGERYVMEATPQYFQAGERTVEAIKSALDRPRIIIIFRDPVTRTWSDYRFKKRNMTIPRSMSFNGYVAQLEQVRRERLPRSPETNKFYRLAAGFYIDHLGRWFDAFGDNLRIWFFEHLSQDPQTTVADICDWLDIDKEITRSFIFSTENRSVQYRNRWLQR